MYIGFGVMIHDMTVTVEIQNEVSSMSNNLSNTATATATETNKYIYLYILPALLNTFQYEKTIKIYII